MVDPRTTPACDGGMTGVAPVFRGRSAGGAGATAGGTSPSWFRRFANSASTTRRGGDAGEAAGDAATSGAAATGAMAGGLAADSNLATSAGRLGWAAVPGGATASGTASEVGV